MEYSNISGIAQKILSDIMNDAPLSSIMLKVKIFAAKKPDKDLLDWVSNELKGYNDKPPIYRIIDCGVKMDIHRDFQEVLGFEYPVEMIKDEKIRERVLHIALQQPISEIEEFVKGANTTNIIHVPIPVPIWYNHMGHCISGQIQRAYQFTTVASMKNVLVEIKSKLIDYFLKIDNNEEIDFASVMRKEEMQSNITHNTTYNAAIVNTGNGNVEAHQITNIASSRVILNDDKKSELKEILDKIASIAKQAKSPEFADLVNEADEEIKKPQSEVKIIKRCFQAMKGLSYEVGVSVIADQLSSLLTKALSLLPF